jgi:hypothetical protein
MHPRLIRYPAPRAESAAGHLHDAWCAQLAAAPSRSDTAHLAPAAQQSKTAIIMDFLAALAIAVGGYAR